MATDPTKVALQFNECINNRDLDGLSRLMSEDHTFIDRAGRAQESKVVMVENWREFFKLVPDYRNTFEKLHAEGNLVAIRGFAFWADEKPHDPVIWTAKIAGELVAEWRIYEDSAENRKRFRLE